MIQNIRGLVQFHQELGVDGYPKTTGLVNFLRRDTKKTGSPENNAGHLSSDAKKRTAKKEILIDVHDDVQKCRSCNLHENMIYKACGQGPENAKLFIVGEWPSMEGNEAPDPFKGDEGELLTRMLGAIDMKQGDVFITSIVKCCAGDSTPDQAAIRSCLPFLFRQIETVSPKVIFSLGLLAAQALLNSKESLLRLRGRFHTFKSLSGTNIPLMPSFHPSFLLKNPDMKKGSWDDLRMIQKMCRK